jgi:hypothetical protein
VRENAGIECICLRQLFHCFGKIPNLAWVDDGKGELGHGEGRDQGTLPAPSRFARHQRELQLVQLRDTCRGPPLSLGTLHRVYPGRQASSR